jgi:hypothetical protein
MKPYTISSNSWHFRIATTYGYLESYDVRDICQYLRSFIVGCVAIVAITTFSALLSFFLLMLPIIVLISQFTVGFHIPLDDVLPPVAISTIFLVTIVWAGYWFEPSRVEARYIARTKRHDHQPSFSQLVYKKFKESTCVRLKVE